MNIKDIENLIKFVQKSGVSEVSLEQKDFKITIKTQSSVPIQTAIQYAPAPQLPTAPPAAAPAPAAPAAAAPKASDDSKYVTIKSPMIGTFYRSSTPEKPPFVNVGDEVKPGKNQEWRYNRLNSGECHRI